MKQFCIIVAIFLLAGCAAPSPKLAVTSLTSGQKYQESFTRAYAARDSAGDYQIVLVRNPLDDASNADANEPLKPTTVPPVRQIVHIRLLWRPMRGTKPDSPAATNASLHWYAISLPTSGGVSYIHYSGTAFVAVVPNGVCAEIRIRNGLLKLTDQHGDMFDPLGKFTINGTFDAVVDMDRIDQTLADVKADLSGATTQPALPF